MRSQNKTVQNEHVILRRVSRIQVVCNGELYGFEKQKATLKKKGYTFMSDSDCEILLPMYFEYGTDMFAMLDAEFACIIYDGKTGEYIAACDPIGIRPLYYGYDGKRLNNQLCKCQ